MPAPLTLALDNSPASAAKVIQGLFWGLGDELIEISVKTHTGRGAWKAHHVTYEQMVESVAAGTLEEWSRKGRDVYFGVTGVVERPAEQWRRGGAALRGTAGALWVDIDCAAPGREGPDYFETIPDLMTAVDHALLVLGQEWGQTLVDSTLVLGSGWGCQYWIPLKWRVPAIEASRLTRVLCAAIAAHTDKKIDRLWDTTRVMRLPGTWNWRSGPDPDEAMPTGVLRWPSLTGRGGRLSYENVTDILLGETPGSRGDRLDWGESHTLTATGGYQEKVDKLLESFCGTDARIREPDPDYFEWDEGVSIEELAEQVWSWEDILEPHGWTMRGVGTRETVWLRPGKDVEPGDRWRSVSVGERSAVVYEDKPELLVVFSDSEHTGFSRGLRGGGVRGDAAGVGVISKWRAWVDLNWAGDTQEALKAVWEGKVGELSDRYVEACEWMTEAADEMVFQADRLAAGGLE